MYIILLSVILFLLISLLIYINSKIGFKPIKDYEKNLFVFESYTDSNECSQSNTVDSIRSCFQEVIKGKNNYISNLNNELKNDSTNNASDIKNINNQIKNINNSIDTIKKNVEESSQLLKTKQNDILSKANQTTETLKKAQEAKDKIDADNS